MSLLSSIQTKVAIDVDSMDPDVAQRHVQACPFVDMTSNQAIVFGELSRSERAQTLTDAIASIKASDDGQNVDGVIDLAVIQLLTSCGAIALNVA